MHFALFIFYIAQSCVVRNDWAALNAIQGFRRRPMRRVPPARRNSSDHFSSLKKDKIAERQICPSAIL